ncbi:MAG: YibE/F family protein, partial [Acidimicrobiia bacterium]|nr:YibE/F family protein [Acidimicrobiia bacterium]
MHSHEAFEPTPDSPILRAIQIGVAGCLVAVLIGAIVLWPTAEGRENARETAAALGLASERIAAEIVVVEDGPCSYATADNPQTCRTFVAEPSEGDADGTLVPLPEFNLDFDTSLPDLEVGDRVILGYEPSTDFWFYADRERRGALVGLALLFVVVVVALGRMRGARALLAMAGTLAVFAAFIAPSVLEGNDPVAVAVVAAGAIAVLGLPLTHGFNATTTVALAATLAALGLTLGLSAAFFEIAAFTGYASEESTIIPFLTEGIDMGALLLGGAIIGALGALDDITVTQVATVAEVHRRSPELGFAELMQSGLRVGREHIASTVNTLLLAYTGAGIPILLLFAVADQPLGIVLNSELIAVEIARTLTGSMGLVAATPLATALAAAVLV